MTNYGKINLLGMLLLPCAATVAALWVFGPLAPTLVTVFALNLVPVLISGGVSGLLLRSANRVNKGQWVALLPTVVPTTLGIVWYLFRAGVPAAVAPGSEYIAAPNIF